MTAAIVLDLDGVIVDTEQAWDRARRDYVAAHGGHWREGATRAMQGMSSREWPRYLREELGADGEPDQISREVAADVLEEVHRDLPLLPGAVDAVRALAGAHTLGLASSANREVIDAVLETAGVAACFGATVSSEEVARGKPAPDVYLEAAARLGVEAARCAAVEDSTNGLLAAKAAGMLVVAVPNREFPPSEEALAVADAVLDGIAAVPAYFMR